MDWIELGLQRLGCITGWNELGLHRTALKIHTDWVALGWRYIGRAVQRCIHVMPDRIKTVFQQFWKLEQKYGLDLTFTGFVTPSLSTEYEVGHNKNS